MRNWRLWAQADRLVFMDKETTQNNTQGGSQEQGLFPMRINKYLAMEGRGSRREMDEVIAAGKVLINGKTAVLGDKVNETDKVEVRFRGTQEKKQGNHMAAVRRAKKARRK